MNVDLMEWEQQQAQVALKTPKMGGVQSTSLPQAAQTMRSDFIRKSASSSAEHLQATPIKVPNSRFGKGIAGAW
jgi:hypothetical protein